MTEKALTLRAYEPDQLDTLVKCLEEDYWFDPPEDLDHPYWAGFPRFLLEPEFRTARVLVGEQGQRYVLMAIDEEHEMRRCAWAKVQRSIQEDLQ